MKNILTIVLVWICTNIFANTDKYRLILNDEPATKITVAWNQISGNNPVVYYGTQDFGTNFNAYPNQKTVDRTTNFRGMSNQFARISNLTPNTAYYFVIKDSEGVSERFWFKTAPADRSRLSFIAGGDSRNNPEPRQNANRLVAKLKPNAVLFGGDMTFSDNNTQWQNWFNDWQLTIASDGRMFPIVATRGNHEDSSTIYQLFDTPNTDSYYAITFGDEFFRIYTLNTEISVLGDQKTWLEQDLADNANVYWKSAQYHKPIRPHQSGKSEGVDRYEAWANNFYQHGVKLAIECDSHMVKTTYPVKPSSGFNDNSGFVQSQVDGTVYAGEGCWGAPLRANDDDKSWTRSSGSFNQFKWFFVDEQKIEMKTIKVDNAVNVGEVTNDNPFQTPTNLDIWQMSDGENTVYIYPTVEAEFSPNMVTNFATTQVNLSVDITKGIENVTSVSFYAIDNLGNETMLDTVNSAPYQLETYVPNNGQYTIRAEISTAGESFDIFKTINAGDFTSNTFAGVSQGSNDITQQQDGDMVFDETQLYLGYRTSGGYESTGIRFENVNIPKDAVIDYAYIEFTPSDNKSENAESTITIEDVPDSSPFGSESFNLRDRQKATEELIWTIPEWTTDVVDANTRTPELKNLIQLITEKSDWEQGNAITFSFAPSGVSTSGLLNTRKAYAHENDPTKAPKLVYAFSFESSQWSAVAEVAPGVGVNTEEPQMPLDINGIMRSSVRNADNQLYQCNENLEGAIGYDKKDHTLKVCTQENEKFQWKKVDLK